MKQLFLTTAMALSALALMTACSTDDTASEATNTTQDKVAIGFENYVGRANTRGSVTDASTVQTSGFGVYAYYTAASSYSSGYSPNLMDNFQVTGSGVGETDESWTYSNTRYWPTTTTDRVSFLAYAPYTSGTSLVSSTGSAESTDDRTYIAYNAGTDVSSQKDILYNSNNALNQYYYGTETGQYSDDLNATTKRVKMKFTHATSRIAFKVTSSTLPTTAGSTTIKVTGITIGDATTGFYKSGNLNLDPTTAATRWAGQTGNQDYTYSLSSSNELTTKTDAVNVGSTNNYLFVIPKDFSTGTTLPVSVSFTIEYIEGASVSGYTASGTLAQNFEAGKAYLITMDLDLSGGSLSKVKPIQFTVEAVENWGTETEKAVTF